MKSKENDNDKLTKEEKIQILVKIIPIVLIIVILLITLAVKSVSNRKDSGESSDQALTTQMPQEDALTDVLEGSPVPTIMEIKPTALPNDSSSPTPYKEVMESESADYSKVTFHTEEQLKEMMTYWEDGNQKALDDLANLDRFKAMSYQLKGTKKFFYYGDKNVNGNPDGKGIAVYADNQYYYGEWKNGVREGKGTWIHYHIHLTKQTNDLILYHQYVGDFVQDLPDGKGQEHYDYHTELFQKGVAYNTNYLGTYQKGLLNGDFYITSLYADGDIKDWNATAKEGKLIYQHKNKDSKGRGPVMVDTSNPDNYIWMSEKENQNLGVVCYISEKK